MEQGRTEQILERLMDMIENGASVPLSTGKVMINKEEATFLLRELEELVKTELKMYREVTDRRGKIITEAKKEAEEIVYQAEQNASRIRVTKRMSSIDSAFRMDSLDPMDREALRTANDIYAASLIYTDEMLTEVNDVVAEAYDMIQSQYNRVIDTLAEKARMIEENKAELMSSLHELSAEERYSQILELGQLLSNELYIERMKARGYEIDKVDVADQKDRPQETVEEIPIVEEQTRMAQEQERPATPIMSIVDESVKDLEEKAEEPPVKEEQNDISAI
ncbi:MAG: hypothetical protein PUB54_00550 [Lachnospiraceae bacterium]|nr:hypothetical protein [Lachnospiraceae bacterium]